MALKNLYDMVKADRYTADGREAIIKAQEEETEDKVYQIGEISQKTGLQKTANGWVKPKSGKQPGAKENGPLSPAKRKAERIAKMQKETGKAAPYGRTLKGTPKTPDDNPLTERTQNRAEGRAAHAAQFQKPTAGNNLSDIPDFKGMESGDYDNKLRAEGWTTGGWEGNGTHSSAVFKKGDRTIRVNEGQPGKITSVQEISKPEGRNFRSELEANPKGAYDFEKTVEKSIPLSAGDKEVLGNVKSFMREEGTDYKDALKSVATGLVNGNKLHGDWYPEKEKSLLKIAKAVGMDEEVKSYVKTMAKGYDFGYSEDAAPRVLTGDTRIRVRKA